jgi:hypothetical protein
LAHHHENLSSETTKREILILLALFVGAVAAYFWVRSLQLPLSRAPDGHYVLADPDSFVRWRLVERALAGEGVRIHWMPDENAPYGHLNAWTSPMTILGVGLVRSAEWFGGMSRAQALEWGGLWLGPIVGLMGLAALGFLGWRVGGWLLAACWLIAWPVLIDVISITGFGNTDHHSLHQLLFICVVAGCLAWVRKPTSGWGIFVGLAMAVAIWSAGSEILPAGALVAGLAVWELGRGTPDDAHVRFWRGWWVSGLLGTAAAWLFEFWPHVFHGRLEFISVWHVTLWVIIGGLLELFARLRISLGWKLIAFLLAAGIAIISAAAMKGFDWQHLHVMQDLRLKRLMSVTTECMPYPRRWPQALQQAWIDFGLLPLLSLGLLFGLKAQHLRIRWLVLVTACYLLLTLYQVRWLDFFVPLLVMTAGLGVTRLRSRDPLLCLVIMFLATIPPWMISASISRNLKLAGANPMRGPYLETFALRAASDCLGASAQHPIVLAAWEQSSILAGMGKVRVVGSGFWSNLDGLADSWEMLTTSSEERFWQLARKRKVEFLLVPSPARFEQDIRQSFKALNERLPTQQEISKAYVWHLVRNDRFPTLSCEEMSRLGPTWKIVRLSGVVPALGGG